MTSRALCLALLALVAAPRPAASAPHTCTYMKLGATARKLGAKLKCHRRAAERGAGVDAACLTKAEQDLAARFTTAELHLPCFAPGDAGTVEAKADALVDDVVTALRPSPDASLCGGGKLAAAGKRAAATLSCHRSAVARGAVVKPDCLARVDDRFLSGFARAELRPDCLTASDSEPLASAVDAFLADAVAELRPRAPSECAARKLRAVGAKAAGKLDCHALGARDGVSPAPACIAAVEAAFSADVGEAEAEADCVTLGDEAALEAEVDGVVDDLATALGPITAPSACAERKLREAGDRAQGKLACQAVAAGNGWPIVASCTSFVEDRFADGFAAAESGNDCVTSGDEGAIGAAVDAFVDDAVAELLP